MDDAHGSDVGLTNPLSEEENSAPGELCMAKDEGLTNPTRPQGLVPIGSSELQGCMKTDGDSDRPTFLFRDSQVRNAPSVHRTCLEICFDAYRNNC